MQQCAQEVFVLVREGVVAEKKTELHFNNTSKCVRLFNVCS